MHSVQWEGLKTVGSTRHLTNSPAAQVSRRLPSSHQAPHRRHHVRRRGQERRSCRGPLRRGAEGPEEKCRGILSLLFPSEHASVSTMPASDSSGCDGRSVKVYASSMNQCHIPPLPLSPHFFVKMLSNC